MSEKHAVELGPVQKTLFIPLYGRAVESRKKHPVLRDPKAVEMVDAIDYDFTSLDDRLLLFGSVVRTAIFDCAARAFLAEHPTGTVVEIGTGLNTRFERVDNGRLRWIDLDLPDVIALRSRFFVDSARRRMLSGSLPEPGWVSAVQASPGPYLFLIEAVLLYLKETDVRRAIALIAENFPGARVVFDTAGRRMVEGQSRRTSLATRLNAHFAWACDDPAELEQWVPGSQLVASYDIAHPPRELRPALPRSFRYLSPVLSRILWLDYKFNTITMP